MCFFVHERKIIEGEGLNNCILTLCRLSIRSLNSFININTAKLLQKSRARKYFDSRRKTSPPLKLGSCLCYTYILLQLSINLSLETNNWMPTNFMEGFSFKTCPVLSNNITPTPPFPYMKLFGVKILVWIFPTLLGEIFLKF